MNAISKNLMVLGGMMILSLGGCLRADSRQVSLYNGSSDASAAAAVNNRYFVVGDDEINILREYPIDGSSDPVFSLDISDFLKTDAEHPESDIEALAKVGQRIYWMTSHGRNKVGKFRSSRNRFFATDIQNTDPNKPPQLATVGKACSTLVNDMLASPQLSKLKLQEVTRFDELLTKKQEAQLAPKMKGLNIEGLAAGPDGKSLWIGLRNPLYDDQSGKPKAIVIPLLNPAQVIEEGQKAIFGQPILLDLDGRGIRTIDYLESQKEYWIVAGSTGARSEAGFGVYRYRHSDMKLTLVKVDFPKKFTPESLLFLTEPKTVCFISDDGTIPKKVESPTECIQGQLLPDGSCPNKCLVDISKRTFRVFKLDMTTLQ
jgi:hypothetical protein